MTLGGGVAGCDVFYNVHDCERLKLCSLPYTRTRGKLMWEIFRDAKEGGGSHGDIMVTSLV